MNEPLLEVRDLRVGFQTDQGLLVAVDDVDLTLGRGRMLGLVGESGCGKSVTARAIMRLLEQPSGRVLNGEVRLEGRDLLPLPLEAMRKVRGKEIAMIFQEPMTALNPVHRVGRQIVENLLLHEDITPAAALKRAVELMEWVGIPAPDQRVNDYPHQLSGGMRQRVMIAMALVTRPEILIADEPTTALDVTIQRQVLDLIKARQRELGTAVIFITHDLAVVSEVCDDVNVMYAGRFVERAPVRALFETPRHAYTRALQRSIPAMQEKGRELYTIPGLPPNLAREIPGCAFAPRCATNEGSPAHAAKRPELVEVGAAHWVQDCAGCLAG